MRVLKSTFILGLISILLLFPLIASAHLSTFGSWETTEKHLKTLFPEATKFLIKSDKYHSEEIQKIEKELGFKLFPEDLSPTFYLAIKDKKFLGVVMFIDPRMKEEKAARFDVGVAVDKAGKIKRIRLFENRALLALAAEPFLDQFVGLSLKSTFALSKNEKINAIEGAKSESQLVSNAAYEALYLMKISLSKKKK